MSCSSDTFAYFIIITIYLLICPYISFAQQIWIQVDDANPAIQYTGDWEQGPCGGCISPNLVNVFNATWHQAYPSRSSGSMGLTFQYYGSSVLVSGLLDNVDPTMTTVATITLDGTPFAYYYTSTDDGTITTDAGIYNNADLAVGYHTLSIEVEAQSAFFLDFIAYYSATPPATTTTTNDGSTGRIDDESSLTSTSTTQNTSPTDPTTTSSGSGATVTNQSSSGFSSNTGTSSFNPAIVHLVNSTVSISTTVDSSGHTLLIPITTVKDQSSGSISPTSSSSDYGKSKISISAPIAGAIGAIAVVAGAVIVFGCFICLRERRKRLYKEKGGLEPYLLVASASSQGSALQSAPPTPTQPSPSASVNPIGLHRNKSITLDTPGLLGTNVTNTPVTPNFLSPTSALQYPYLLPSDPFVRPAPPSAPHPSTSRTPQRLNIETEGVTVASRTTVRRGRRLKEPLDPIPLPQEPSPRELREGVRFNSSGLATAGEREADEEEDEHENLPVARRQSLTHPAPPAYSPPRMVRNLGPQDE